MFGALHQLYDDAFNIEPAQVAYHGLIEENKIHHGIALVELLQFGIQNSFQFRRVRDGDVCIRGTRSTERCEYHRLLEHFHLLVVREGFSGKNRPEVVRLELYRYIDETKTVVSSCRECT